MISMRNFKVYPASSRTQFDGCLLNCQKLYRLIFRNSVSYPLRFQTEFGNKQPKNTFAHFAVN